MLVRVQVQSESRSIGVHKEGVVGEEKPVHNMVFVTGSLRQIGPFEILLVVDIPHTPSRNKESVLPPLSYKRKPIIQETSDTPVDVWRSDVGVVLSRADIGIKGGTPINLIRYDRVSGDGVMLTVTHQSYLTWWTTHSKDKTISNGHHFSQDCSSVRDTIRKNTIDRVIRIKNEGYDHNLHDINSSLEGSLPFSGNPVRGG